jgi:hypothetical protein
MFKITGLDQRHYDAVVDFSRPLNEDNVFYIWPGQLKSSENELLLLINLRENDFPIFEGCLESRVSLEEALSRLEQYEGSISDHRIISLLSFLRKSCSENERSIRVEKPFQYTPYIRNIYDYDLVIHGKKIVPIGDSLFTGHPKVGNGLGFHFQVVKFLAEKASKALG